MLPLSSTTNVSGTEGTSLAGTYRPALSRWRNDSGTSFGEPNDTRTVAPRSRSARPSPTALPNASASGLRCPNSVTSPASANTFAAAFSPWSTMSLMNGKLRCGR